MAKKIKKSKEELGSLEDIDTTVLNLQQLQEFCSRVHKEIGKVEIESRGLEMERNKLKTMVDIAEYQMKEAKSSRRRTDELLDEEKEKFTIDMLKMLNSVRNVCKESGKESSCQLLKTTQKIKSLTEAHVEAVHEIENDITATLDAISKHDKITNDNFIILKLEYDKEISKTVENFGINNKLSMTQLKKMSKEIIKTMTDECVKELENFNDYKNKKIKEHLKENNKKMVDFRHHCEKIQHHNTLILDNLHENYKVVKGDTKYLESSVKNQKLNYDQMVHEMIENTEKNKNMSQKLGNSKRGKYEVDQIKWQRVTQQKKLDDLHFEEMLLDEILTVRKRTQAKEAQCEEKEFMKLQLKITEWLVELENMATKLSGQVRVIDEVVDMAMIKRHHLGQELTSEQIRELVLANLEDEAVEEVMREVRVSIARTSNSIAKARKMS